MPAGKTNTKTNENIFGIHIHTCIHVMYVWYVCVICMCEGPWFSVCLLVRCLYFFVAHSTTLGPTEIYTHTYTLICIWNHKVNMYGNRIQQPHSFSFFFFLEKACRTCVNENLLPFSFSPFTFWLLKWNKLVRNLINWLLIANGCWLTTIGWRL